jgi:hypothetical protein
VLVERAFEVDERAFDLHERAFEPAHSPCE